MKKIIKKERAIEIGESKANIRVLGLDCSSSTIGWGLVALNEIPCLLAHGHIKPLDAKHDLLKRLNGVYEAIEILCEKYSPTHVSIEDILLFMKGKSKASTITILASFNRVVALSAYRNSKAEIIFYPSQTIRKIIKNAYKCPKRLEKEEIPDLIIDKLNSAFEKILNKKNKVANETYDEADGIAAAWACALELKDERSI